MLGAILQQNGKELQANAGRRAGKLHSKWHVDGETDGRPRGRVSSEIPRSTSITFASASCIGNLYHRLCRGIGSSSKIKLKIKK